MDKIYAVYQVTVKDKTDESRRRDFEIHKLIHNKYHKTFEQYEEFLKSWDDYYYYYGFELNALFKNYSSAEEAVKTNCCGIDEAGVFNYAIIVGLPLDAMYAEAEPTSKVDVFKYVEPDSYIKVNGDMARHIRKHWLGIIELKTGAQSLSSTK